MKSNCVFKEFKEDESGFSYAPHTVGYSLLKIIIILKFLKNLLLKAQSIKLLLISPSYSMLALI